MPTKPKPIQIETMLPTPINVRETRVAAGLTQCQAAEMAGLAHGYRWSEYERGVQVIGRAHWELFLIKVGKHLLYGPRKGVPVPTLDTAVRENPTIGEEKMIVPKKHVREARRIEREFQAEVAAKRAKAKARARTT